MLKAVTKTRISTVALLSAMVIPATLMSAAVANAHHSFSATFQRDARITVKGTITRVTFKNPHVLIYMDVISDDGVISQWVAEGPSAISMRRSGWETDTVKSGDMISVYGDSTHDGSPMVSLENVFLLDVATGEQVKPLLTDEDNPYTQESPASEFNELPLRLDDGRPNLTALWSFRQPAQVEGARLPPFPYNAAGKARKALFDVRHDPQVFCDAPGLIRQVVQNPYPVKITQYDDRVTLEYEEYNGYREVPFADALPELGVKTMMGDSVARYVGDTLVIETVNFFEMPGTTVGDYISDEGRLEERYTRDDDDIAGAVLELTAIMNDPKYLTKPHSITRRKSILTGYQYTENACEVPLRERTVVSSYMSGFVASMPALSGVDVNAHCEALALDMQQGGKVWIATSEPIAPNGASFPFYTATSTLLTNANLGDLNITEQGSVVETLAADQLYCFATQNLIAPASSQRRELGRIDAEGPTGGAAAIVQAADAGTNDKSWLLILGALILAGLGFALLRRKKT